MKAKNKVETIIVRVDEDLKQGLIKLAEDSRREFSDYVRLVLEDTLKKKVRV